MKGNRGRGERGQATIEFAIVLPLVLLLVAGIIEFGKGFNYWLNLNHLANEGARWVAVDKLPAYGSTPSTQSPTKALLTSYLVGQITTEELRTKIEGDANAITVCTTPSSGLTPLVGDQVRVRIRTPYALPLVASVADFASKLVGGGSSTFGTLTLAGSATVRLEQPLTNGSPGYTNPCP